MKTNLILRLFSVPVLVAAAFFTSRPSTAAFHQSSIHHNPIVQTQRPLNPTQVCIPSGVGALACGCWGPAFPGQDVPAWMCCSGAAERIPCFGGCPYGGSPWRTVCL